MKLGYFWRFEIPIGICPSGHEWEELCSTAQVLGGGGGGEGALVSICSFILKLVPSTKMVSAWWRRRSSTAEVMVLSLLKMEGHCLKALLVVNTMEPRS